VSALLVLLAGLFFTIFSGLLVGGNRRRRSLERRLDDLRRNEQPPA
jgi:hypothetical protein